MCEGMVSICWNCLCIIILSVLFMYLNYMGETRSARAPGGLEPEGFKSARGRRLKTNTPGKRSMLRRGKEKGIGAMLRRGRRREKEQEGKRSMLRREKEKEKEHAKKGEGEGKRSKKPWQVQCHMYMRLLQCSTMWDTPPLLGSPRSRESNHGYPIPPILYMQKTLSS